MAEESEKKKLQVLTNVGDVFNFGRNFDQASFLHGSIKEVHAFNERVTGGAISFSDDEVCDVAVSQWLQHNSAPISGEMYLGLTTELKKIMLENVTIKRKGDEFICEMKITSNDRSGSEHGC